MSNDIEKKKIGWFVVLLLIIFSIGGVYLLSSSDPNLKILAQGRVAVYESIDSALSTPPKQIIDKLEPEQVVNVVKYIDVKHYQIFKVRLPNGRIGFINDGKYKLLPTSQVGSGQAN